MSAHDWLQWFGLVAATFVSEDATCIAAGLLIHGGCLHWTVGVSACFVGIVAGDLGLWLLGRLFGPRVLAWGWVQRRLPSRRLDEIGRWFDRRGWAVVFAARCLPGARVPVYLAAGVLGRQARWFAFYAVVAAVVWTPTLVLLVAAAGGAIVGPLHALLGHAWAAVAVAVAAVWLGVRLAATLAAPFGRERLWAAASRVWRWEFWPAWLFYLPLAPWLAYLALRRGGLMAATAANPGIVPHGGVVGESKFAILSKLPTEWIVPSVLVEPAPVDERVGCVIREMAARGWSFPLILKPDAGQRGAGLRKIHDPAAMRSCFEANPRAVLAQTYHPGPFEAGVFYTRIPGEPRGRIFSITDKLFPVLIGDGVSTAEALVWRHPRFRMQASTFLSRLDGQALRVLGADERLPLAVAGNHCQGALFRDGGGLRTPALEAAIDSIAQQFEGFHFGRFDVRYGDPDEFRAGLGFRIVELNGVTSESTNLYDPAWSLLRAYRVLFEQWAILYRIGAENRRRGVPASSLARVLADARAYYRERRADLRAD